MKEPVEIIIPVYNLKEYTRRCIKSIEEWTRVPYELILIDNGSATETAEYLSSIEGAHLIVNKENLGYAKAINQGILSGRGEYVLFLNNDTIVTKNWLENLLFCLKDHQRNGIVGPLTNGIANPNQRYEVEFDTLGRLYSFAQYFNQRDPRCWFDLAFLSGFCMLTRRSILEEVGILDESFGPALQEDYDLCRRVRLAGYRTLCAGDTFVYHYYSQTFLHHNIDREKMLEESLTRYRRKWREGS